MWKRAWIGCKKWVSDYRNYYQENDAIGVDVPLWNEFCNACGGEEQAIVYCEKHYEEW